MLLLLPFYHTILTDSKKLENMNKFQDIKIRLLQSDGTSSDAQQTFNLEIKIEGQLSTLKASNSKCYFIFF